jgi:hypothetical protein
MTSTPSALPLAERIRTIRGHKVMLDAELAELYGVPTRALVQAVKRNAARFPSDFMFSITEHEVADLKSQIVTSSFSSRTWGGRRPPRSDGSDSFPTTERRYHSRQPRSNGKYSAERAPPVALA